MTDASWIERSVLIALMVASLTLFWLRFRKVLEAIRGARATPISRWRRWARASASPLGGDGASEGDRPAAPARRGPRIRLLGFLPRSRWSLSTTSQARSARAFSPVKPPFGSSISDSWRCGPWRWRWPYRACSSAAFSCARCGLGSCRRNRASVALLIFLLMATWLGGLWLRR